MTLRASARCIVGNSPRSIEREIVKLSWALVDEYE
jgi:hypothetical protein